jgi:Cu/Ag efflux pump CusA
VVDGYPGIVRDVQTYLKERIREVLTGASNAVVVRLYGDDLALLRSKAAEIHSIFDATEGAIDVQTALQKDIPQLNIEVDLAKAQSYGLKPGDVRRAAATLVAGEEVGDVYRGGKAYDVQVWSPPAVRSDVSASGTSPLTHQAGRRSCCPMWQVSRSNRRRTSSSAMPTPGGLTSRPT